MILTGQQLRELTGAATRKKQLRWLRAAPLKEGAGGHWMADPLTGSPIVFDWWLSGGRPKRAEPRTEPNWGAIRRRDK